MYIFIFIIIGIFSQFLKAQNSLLENTALPVDLLYDIQPFINNTGFYTPAVIDSGAHRIILTDIQYNQIYLQKINGRTLNDIYNWKQENIFYSPLSLYNHIFLFSLRLEKNVKSFYSENEEYTIKYKQNHALYNFSFQTNFYNNNYTLLAGFGAREYHGKLIPVPVIGLSFRFLSLLSLTYNLKFDQINWDFIVYYSNNTVKIKQVEKKAEHSALLGLNMLNNKLKFEMTYRLNNYNNKNLPEKDINIIAAQGILQSYGINASLKNSLWFKEINFKMFYLDYSANGRFYHDRTVFGKITKIKTRFRLLEAFFIKNYANHDIGPGLAWGNGLLEAKGYIDTWPFTDTWIDLLGLRRMGNAQYNYNYLNGILSYKRNYKNPSSWRIQLSYEKLFPDGRMNHWQPQFLVFGIKNLKTNKINIKEQNGLYFKLIINQHLSKRVRLIYNFNQYIPLYTKKKEKNISTGDSNTKTYKKRFVYGGGQQYLQLQFNF